MEEEELIKKLKNVSIPEVTIESHRTQLRTALLAGRSKKESLMQTLTNNLFAPRPTWKVASASILALLTLFTTFISIPQTSVIIKATLFPEGSRQISGPQLPAADEEKARQILNSDPAVKELLSKGAVIDKILPIEVMAETRDPQTGAIQIIRQTWAQAWLVKGSQDWGVQIDLVEGKVVAITP